MLKRIIALPQKVKKHNDGKFIYSIIIYTALLSFPFSSFICFLGKNTSTVQHSPKTEGIISTANVSHTSHPWTIKTVNSCAHIDDISDDKNGYTLTRQDNGTYTLAVKKENKAPRTLHGREDIPRVTSDLKELEIINKLFDSIIHTSISAHGRRESKRTSDLLHHFFGAYISQPGSTIVIENGNSKNPRIIVNDLALNSVEIHYLQQYKQTDVQELIEAHHRSLLYLDEIDALLAANSSRARSISEFDKRLFVTWLPYAESTYDPRQIGDAKEFGILQTLPEFAHDRKISKPYSFVDDPAEQKKHTKEVLDKSYEYFFSYLDSLEKYDLSVEKKFALTIAYYNSGPNAVKKIWRDYKQELLACKSTASFQNVLIQAVRDVRGPRKGNITKNYFKRFFDKYRLHENYAAILKDIADEHRKNNTSKIEAISAARPENDHKSI